MPSALAVHAYAIASTLAPREIARLLTPGAQSERLTKTQLTVRTGDTRWLVAYDFGAIVFFGYDEDERNATMSKILEKAGPEPHPPMHEEFLVEIDPDGTPEAMFDRVRLAQLDGRTVDLVALVVAQSAAMEYYEEDVDLLLAKVQEQTRALERRGTFRGSVKELVKFVGNGMSTRNQVVYTLSLLDAPETVWNDERLDQVYRGLRKTFEIEDRYRALDYKLRMVQDNLEILVDLGQTRRSMTLEATIVIMIGIELVLLLYQIFK
jgi:uncharacterized Rmd1/YagE family protein